MSLLQRALVSVTAAFIFAFLCVAAEHAIDRNCLGCLCEAATQCNATAACKVTSDYVCGPFHITWAYWVDAGKPVLKHDKPDNEGAFENCAHDLYCAAQVVENYTNIFAKDPKRGDCNGDGEINCIDFAYMHRLGGYRCKNPSMLNTTFYQKFNTCWQVVQAAMPKKSS